ncbi:stage III sporulation protein AG [Brevibacillus sp. MS2.2]|uniref:stage III sporulation protein AG n=1 Tax=Brevibacillus sp. MS2.2 TaxID=2738981 RepID=UPI00156B3DF1|nr:stage III sporulation protein AG [Brevibacillus sp. MS2.2]NRR20323.1 stage III sporulation protein AG [Brevibacillus sp. MS2.2]
MNQLWEKLKNLFMKQQGEKMQEEKKIVVGSKGKNQKLKPLHYFIVILGIGVAIMILTDFLRVEKDQPLGFGDIGNEAPGPPGGDSTSQVLGGSPTTDIIAEYENIYETQLRDILASVVGVGEVEVMVNLESTPELVVEKNRNIRSSTNQEMDKEKATRNQNDQSRDEQVVIVQGGKQDAPVIVKTLKPKVRGVLVVAKGADNIQVKAWITEAVQKVLDVPAYKISILPKKG